MKTVVPTAIRMLVLCAGSVIAVSAQQPTEKTPVFEAATIKLAAPDATPNAVRPTSPNRLSIPSMTLTALIYNAYGDGGFNTAMRVTGGPDWINKTAFAVEGVASATQTPRQLRLMLQALLEERFALKVRVEATSGEMLTLVMLRNDGSLGPKVQKWSGSCPKVMPILVFQAPRRPLLNGPALEASDPNIAECPTGYRAGGITLDGVTMSTVAEVLSLPPARALLGTIVTDQTGLQGRYTLELDFPFPVQRPADPSVQADLGLPSLSTAVQEQWGLRLVRGKGPFRLVVVEGAQPPTEN